MEQNGHSGEQIAVLLPEIVHSLRFSSVLKPESFPMLSELGVDDIAVIWLTHLGQRDLLGTFLAFDSPGAFVGDVMLEKVQESSCKVNAAVTIPSPHPAVLDKVRNVQGLPLFQALKMSILATEADNHLRNS